jgi:uncharacterized membrane protein
MKKMFAKGLAALLPTLMTVFVLLWIYNLLVGYIAEPMGSIVKWGVGIINNLGIRHWILERIVAWAEELGLVLGFGFIFVIGTLVATFFGKKIVLFTEKRILSKIPLIKVIYPYAKQFTEFFFKGEDKLEFKAVVAVPFPTAGTYSIGFPVSHGFRHLNAATDKKMLGVFIPTAPMAFTGFVIFVPREQVIPLPITVEEAMRTMISCGVIMPPHQAVSMTELPDIKLPDPGKAENL